MNSLSQLNSLDAIAFEDDRTPRVIFDRPIAFNQTVSVNQNDTHSVPVGINIIDIVNPTLTGISVVFTVTQQPSAVISWASLPSGVIVNDSGGGVYTVIGVDSVSDWNAIKSPTFQPDPTFIGTFSYTVAINTVNDSKTFTVFVNIADITNMSQPDDFYYEKNDTGIISGAAVILDNYSTNWTVTVTPSNINYITTLSTAGSGGTVSFNNTTKVLTVAGTKTQVNSHLSTISYVTAITAIQDFSLSYFAVNDTTGEADNKIQNWLTLEYLSATRANDSFSVNTQTSITNGPLVTDTAYDGSGNYVMTVTPTDPAAVFTMSSQGKFSWVGGTQVTAGATGGISYLEYGSLGNSDLSLYAVADIDSTVNLGTYTTTGSILIYSRVGTTLTLSNKLFAPTQDTADPNLGDTNGFGYRFDATPDLSKFIVVADGERGAVSLGQDRGAVYIMQPNAAVINATVGSTITVNSVISGTVTNTMLLWNVTDTTFSNPIYKIGNTTKSVSSSSGVFNCISFTRIAAPSSGDYFRGVRINDAGTTAVILSEGVNKVYVYDLVGSTWTLRTSFTGATQYFGDSSGNTQDLSGILFLDNDSFLVTDYSDNGGQGSISVYVRSGSTWAFDEKITPPVTAYDQYFGNNVKINSATQFETDSYIQGSVAQYRRYVYTLTAGTWTLTSDTVSGNRIQVFSKTNDSQFAVSQAAVLKLVGDRYQAYSTLQSDINLDSLISADGEYIVSHRASSNQLKYVRAFVKTANDPLTSNFNETTKTLTIQGTRQFINSEIDTIVLTPETDYTSNIVLTYTLVTPRGDTDSRTQTITYTP